MTTEKLFPCVAICVPVADKVTVQFWRSHHRLWKPSSASAHFDHRGGTHTLDVHGYPVDKARTILTEYALRAEPAATHVLFIDDDMEFAQHSLHRLLGHGLPVVGGLCHNRRPPYAPILMKRHRDRDGLGFAYHYPRGQLFEVDATGAAFLLIERRVLEKVAELHGDGTWWLPINGISEDFSFPVAPETPVLDADWRWRALADYQPGDVVVGFDEQSPANSSRRFQHAVVEEVIHKTLPRVKIVTTEREFVTTGEHPWLAHVGARQHWIWRRTDQLRVGDRLARVVPVERNPQTSSRDYAAGYVQGIFHSDGYEHSRDGRSVFRILMKDNEPVERSATMLARLQIPSVRGAEQWDHNPKHAPMQMLGVYRQEHSHLLRDVVHNNSIPSDDFAAGYLAGKYDGDGSHYGGTAFIHSIVDWKKDRVEECARRLGITFTTRSDKHLRLCGQDEIFRFWQKISPSLTRRMSLLGQPGNDGERRGKEVRHREEKIVAIEQLPVDDVACLRTSSGTFIADGVASHNCQRVKACGFPIHVDCGLEIGHVVGGPVVVYSDFAEKNRPFQVERWAPEPEVARDGEPVATIVIPTLNQRPQHLRAAVWSAAFQTVPVEVIVVDDGSDPPVPGDGWPPNVRVVWHADVAGDPRTLTKNPDPYWHAEYPGQVKPQNRGIAAALNTGIGHMRTDWFCWLSSDDLLDPRKVETQLALARATDAKCLFHRYQTFRDGSDDFALFSDLPTWANLDEQRRALAIGCPFNGSTVMIHRSVFDPVDGVGLFNPDFRYGQDWEFWCRAGQRYLWTGHPEILGSRREGGNLTAEIEGAATPEARAKRARRDAEDRAIRDRYRYPPEPIKEGEVLG